MGNTDSIPFVSQAKSTVQLVCGDTDGAVRTAENFLRECPGVSQATSVVQMLAGYTDEALETQKRCGKGLMKAADGIPIVGHAKGVIHYACGDTEGGNQAMKSATRTTGVLAGGAGGFLIGGPAGAIGGGIYGGTVMDLGTSIITKESTGYVAAIENAVKNPNPGDLFDLALMPVSDGLAGYGAGEMVQKTLASSAQAVDIKAGKALEANGMALYKQMEAKLEANPNMLTGEYVDGMRKAQNMLNKGKAMQGETMSYPCYALKQKPASGATAAALAPNSKTSGKESQEEEYESKRRQKQRYSEKTGGAGEFLSGGPAGAIGGGIYDGNVMDVGTSLVTNESTGYVAAIDNAVKNPNLGDLFDLTLIPVSYGLAGYRAVEMVQKSLASSAQAVDIKSGKALEAKGMALYEQMEAKLEANRNMRGAKPLQCFIALQRFSFIRNMRKESQEEEYEAKRRQKERYSEKTGGAGGFFIGGLAGAIGGGIYGGTVMDYPIFPFLLQVARKESQEEEYKAKRPQEQRYSEKTGQHTDIQHKEQSRTNPTHQWRQKHLFPCDSDEEQCICTHVIIRVLYVNICSINPDNKEPTMKKKIERLKTLINTHQPRIIAFVESWLTEMMADHDVLSRLGLGREYQSFRQDRRVGLNQPNAYCESGGKNNRIGGGIFVAWKTTDRERPMTKITVVRNTAEDYGDNIVNFDITATYSCKNGCKRQETFPFTVVYRRPSPFRNQSRSEYNAVNKVVTDRLIHICNLYKEPLLEYSEGVMVGDFNWRNKNIVGEFLDRTESEIVAMSRSQTHVGGGALDQVIASYGFVTSPYDINTSLVEVTDRVSDHSALVFNLKLGKDIPGRTECKAKKCSPPI